MKKQSAAESKASSLLAREALVAAGKLKEAATIAANVIASAKESSDRDFQLQDQVSKLQGITEQGFKSIDDHFKLLNGQVIDHTKIINKMLASDSYAAGRKQGISVFWKVTSAIILTLAAVAAIGGFFLHLLKL